ncbi:MAG: hypothetical protein R3343_06775 [Nitriliruptorales bacterium]|nr:hypothetical protein [Nitriliruptorales bacterium]
MPILKTYSLDGGASVPSRGPRRTSGDVGSRDGVWRTIGGWAATGAGVAGLLGLLSVIPWPELFAIDARPINAITRRPGLKYVLVGHYAILVAGGVLGSVAGVGLVLARRRRFVHLLGGLLLAGASAAFAYAATVRTIDLSDGRAVEDVEGVVWAGGGVLLIAVVILTLALRRHAGTSFLLLGLGAPVLVVAGIATFMLVGPDFYPEIWGVTFPPPSDYLLAIWFVGLGRVMRTTATGTV